MTCLRLAMKKEGVLHYFLGEREPLAGGSRGRCGQGGVGPGAAPLAGRDVVSILKPLSELQAVMVSDPCAGHDLKGAKALVTFTDRETDLRSRSLLLSPGGDLAIGAFHGCT